MNRRLVGAGLMQRNPDGVLYLVSAGASQTLTSTVTAQLAGSVARGGTGPYTYKWTVFSKPVGSTVAFSDDTSLTSTATVDVDQGTYVLRLRATDANGRVADSYVSLTVALSDVAIFGGLLVEYWDSTLGIALSGGAVDTWTGQVLGSVLQAPGASQRPVYGLDGANFNGRNVVKIDQALGVNNKTLSGTGLSLLPAASRGTLLLVGRFIPGTIENTNTNFGGVQLRIVHHPTTGGFQTYGVVNTSYYIPVADTAGPTSFEIGSNAVTGAQYYVGGSLVGSDGSATPSYGPITIFSLGNQVLLDDTVFYSAAAYALAGQMSAAQRAAMKTYSAARWGTP